MRLFHISEESNISVFHPRLPTRTDLDNGIGLVWAVNERCLPNFLMPRDCPRVTYHVSPDTTPEDRARYLSSPTCPHVVAIESRWFPVFQTSCLYRYEFDPAGFALQDQNAGYYVSTLSQLPLACVRIEDVPGELLRRHVELRVVDNLWELHDAIRHTSFFWSMCRMKNALPR